MRITEFSALRQTVGRVIDKDFDQLAEDLSKPYRSTFTRAQFVEMSKEAQSAEKEKSGGAIWGESVDGHRKKASLPFRCALSLDYDDCGPDIVDRIHNALAEVSYVIYSTIKSTKEKPRVRVIIPTNRLFNQNEHDAVGRLVCGRIGMEGADPSMLQNARLMFYPAVLADQPFIYNYNKGQVLDVDKWLKEYADWTDVSQRPLFPGEDKAFVEAKAKTASIKKRKEETGLPFTVSDPRDKSGLIGAFCEAYPISKAIATFLPTIYTAGDGGRYTFINGHSKNGVVVFDDLLAYSFHSTDPAGMRMLNAYDLVRLHEFGKLDKEGKTYVSTSPSEKAMNALAKADKNVRAILLKRQADNMTLSSSEEEVKRAVDLGFTRLPFTDMGTARRMVLLVGDTVRYDRERSVWFRYQNGVWKKEADISFLYEFIEKAAALTYDAWFYEGREVCRDIEDYRKYAGMNRNQRAVISCMTALLGMESAAFDADDDSINLADGYLSLTDTTHVPHSPDQYCRLKAAAAINGEEYDFSAIEFIEQILPDPETRDYVQRLCGYILGRNLEQKMVFFYGESGNNGKSTFVNLIQNAMGDYAKTGKLDSLLTSKGDGDPERANSSIAMLQNVRAVMMHENDQHRVLRSPEVKRITGNTAVVARFMRENFFEFVPKFTAIVDLNFLPLLADSGDDALKKRVRVIPFTQHFSGAQVDRSLEKKVSSPGWINAYMMWAIDGRKAYLERGLDDYDGSMPLDSSNLPKEVKDALRQYFEESDDVGDYVASCLDITHNPDDFVTFRNLYNDYAGWYVGTPRSTKVFSAQIKKRLEVLGVEGGRSMSQYGVQERGYFGIKLLNTGYIARVV